MIRLLQFCIDLFQSIYLLVSHMFISCKNSQFGNVPSVSFTVHTTFKCNL